jgi:integrase
MSEPCALISTPGSEWHRIEALVLDSVRSANSKRAYGRAVSEFYAWCTADCTTFSKASVQRYRSELEVRGLAASSINVKLSAIRKLATEAADNGLLAPELAAGIARVRGARGPGVRTGHWLTRDQAEQLLEAPDPDSRKGKRDRALLALLLGCGLRRAELAQLTFEQVQQRDGRWVLADLVGKGGKIRTVPVPNWAKPVIDAWAEAAGSNMGRILRPVNKSDCIVGVALGAESICKITAGYGVDLKLEISPHDLRRTFAQLAYEGGAPLEQIQLSLGHASIRTTERYLGIRQDLSDAPCDRLGLRVSKREEREVTVGDCSEELE